jgi:hypothetical protein
MPLTTAEKQEIAARTAASVGMRQFLLMWMWITLLLVSSFIVLRHDGWLEAISLLGMMACTVRIVRLHGSSTHVWR